jgi:hypothetical protein
VCREEDHEEYAGCEERLRGERCEGSEIDEMDECWEGCRILGIQ